MCPSLIEIGSKTAEKNSAQTNRQANRQTDRHYENNGHLAVNQNFKKLLFISESVWPAGATKGCIFTLIVGCWWSDNRMLEQWRWNFACKTCRYIIYGIIKYCYSEDHLLGYRVKVLRPTQHKTGHFGDVLPSQSLGLVLEKLNLTQQKQTTQEQNGTNLNRQKTHSITYNHKSKWKPSFNCKNCS